MIFLYKLKQAVQLVLHHLIFLHVHIHACNMRPLPYLVVMIITTAWGTTTNWYGLLKYMINICAVSYYLTMQDMLYRSYCVEVLAYSDVKQYLVFRLFIFWLVGAIFRIAVRITLKTNYMSHVYYMVIF